MTYSFTKEELTAIKDSNIEYFNKHYSISRKEEFLYEAISLGSLKVIDYFLNQHIELKNNTCLGLLAEKRNKVKVFEYLNSKQINLKANGGYAFYRACLHNRAENVHYLVNHIPESSGSVSRALNFIVFSQHSQDNKNIDDFRETLTVLLQQAGEKTLEILKIEEGRESSEIKSNKKYVFELYLCFRLDNKNQKSRGIKI